MATAAGFKKSGYVSGSDIYQRYFVDRTDSLDAGNAERIYSGHSLILISANSFNLVKRKPHGQRIPLAIFVFA